MDFEGEREGIVGGGQGDRNVGVGCTTFYVLDYFLIEILFIYDELTTFDNL